MTEKSPIYLEDLIEGCEYRSAEHQLDAQQIVEFARQFDPQPFHLDDAAAKDTFFKGLAASGWHTAALTMKLIQSSVPIANGIIGAGGEIGWPRPTRPGDVLRVVSKVVEIKPSRSKPNQGMVTLECLTLNQQDEICQRLVTKLIVMRKPE